jgi:hypothetical protein
MKKLLLLVGIFTVPVCRLYSAGLYQVNGNTVYRTTAPAVATVDMVIATGTIYVDGILVTSASANTESYCLLKNATNTVNSAATMYSTFTYCTSWGATAYPPAYFIPIHRVFTKGLVITNVGVAKIEVLWDWLNGYQPGHSGDGVR